MANKKRGGAREGAGRPPKPPEDAAVYVTLTLPPNLAERLTALAEARGTTKSGLVQELLKRARVFMPKELTLPKE